jgi:tetratricopeptide (TPR) repeat protein
MSILNFYKKWFQEKTVTPEVLDKMLDDGERLFQQGAYEKSLPLFDRALKAFEDPYIYSLRAFTLQALGYHYDAINDFNKAIEGQPWDSNYHFGRAMSKSYIGHIKGHVADLDIALELVDKEENMKYTVQAIKAGYKDGAYGLYIDQLAITLRNQKEGIVTSVRSKPLRKK